MPRLLLLISFTCAACASTAEDGPAPVLTSTVPYDYVIWARPAVDLLLVIDDSPAIAPFRGRIAESVATFATRLEATWRSTPDLHIGVITADPEDGGVLRAPSAFTGRFLTTVPRLEGGRGQNFIGSLSDALVALTDVGTQGSETVQPLAMMRLALEGVPANLGFFRDNTFLAVVVISSREDRSGDPVAAYAEFLSQPRSTGLPAFLWAVFSTDPSTPTCPAEPSIRFPQLVQASEYASSASLCAPDPAGLLRIFEGFDLIPLAKPCLWGALGDADLAREGMQYDCSAELTADGHHLVVPACADEPGPPCWRIEISPVCQSYNHESLQLVRDGLGFPPNTHLVGECLAQ